MLALHRPTFSNVYLAIVLALAFFLRVERLGYKPYFFDEKASIGCATGVPYAGINQVGSTTWEGLGLPSTFTSHDFQELNTFQNLYKSTLEDNGSILYFTTLHFWIKVFGVSKVSVRSLSVLFSLLTVLVLYFVALEYTGSDKVALFSSFILAVHPLAIASAQFCRSHAMAGFFALLATYVLLRFRKQSAFHFGLAFLYGVLCASAMLCHYFTMYIFLGHLVLVWFLGSRKIEWVYFFAGSAFAVFLFCVWLFVGGLKGLSIVSVVHEQFLAVAQHWQQGDNAYFMPSTIRNVAGGWAQTILPIFGNHFQNFGFRLSYLLWMLMVPFGCLGLIFLFKKGEMIERKKLLLLLVLIFIQPVWASCMSFKMGYMIFFQPSYAQYVAPYGAVLLAYAIWMVSREFSKMVYIPIVLVQLSIMLVSDYGVLYPASIEKDFEYEAVANSVDEKYKMGDVVVCNNWNAAFMLGLHLNKPSIPQRVISNPTASSEIFIQRGELKIPLQKL